MGITKMLFQSYWIQEGKKLLPTWEKDLCLL